MYIPQKLEGGLIIQFNGPTARCTVREVQILWNNLNL